MFRGSRISLGKSNADRGSKKIDPDYEEVGPPTNAARLHIGMSVPNLSLASATAQCDLCGNAVASLRCLTCNAQVFCASCDDMYHRHPRRATHERKQINIINGVGGPTRPVLPPKGFEPQTTTVTTNSQQHIPPPQPPPRKNKSRTSFLPTSAFGRKEQSGHETSSTAGRTIMGSLKRIMGNRPLPPPPDQHQTPDTYKIPPSLPRSSTAPAIGGQRPSLPSLPSHFSPPDFGDSPKIGGILPSRSMPPTPPSALTQYPKLQPKASNIGGRKMSLQHLPAFDDKRASMVEPTPGQGSWEQPQQRQQSIPHPQSLQQKNRSQSISDEQWNQVISLQNSSMNHNAHNNLPTSRPGGYPTSEVGGVSSGRNFNTLGRSNRSANLTRGGMVSSTSVCDLNTLTQQHQIQQPHQNQQQQLVPAYPNNMQSANSFQQLNMMGCDPNNQMMWMPCQGCQQVPPPMYPINQGGMKRTASNLSMNLSSVGSDMSGYPWAPPHMHHPMYPGYPGYPGGYPGGCHPQHMGPMSTHNSGMSIPSSPGVSIRSSTRSQKSSKGRSFSTADLSGRRSRAQSKRRDQDSDDSRTSSGSDEGIHIKSSSKLGKSGGLAWQCDHCTFINPGHTDSCGMCSKVAGRTNESVKNNRTKTPHSERRRSDRSRKKSDRDDNHQHRDLSDEEPIKNGKINRRDRYKSSGSVISMSNKSSSRRKSIRRGSSCSPSSGSSDVEDEAARLERQLKELRLSSRSRTGRDYDRMSVTSRTKDTGSLKREGGTRYRNRAKYNSERSRTPGGHSPVRRSMSRKRSTESEEELNKETDSSDPGGIQKPEKEGTSQEGTLVGTTASEKTVKNEVQYPQYLREEADTSRYKKGKSMTSRTTTPGPVPICDDDIKIIVVNESDEQDVGVSEAEEEKVLSDDDEEVFVKEKYRNVEIIEETKVDDQDEGNYPKIGNKRRDQYNYNRGENNNGGLKPEMAYGDLGNYKTDIDDPSFANTLDDVVTLATNEMAEIDPSSQALEDRPTSADSHELDVIEAPIPVFNYIKPANYDDLIKDGENIDDDDNIELIDKAIKALKVRQKSVSPEVPEDLLPMDPDEDMPSVSLAFDPSYEPIEDPNPLPKNNEINDNYTTDNTYQSYKTPLDDPKIDTKKEEHIEEPYYVNNYAPGSETSRKSSLEEPRVSALRQHSVNSLNEDVPIGKYLTNTNSSSSLNERHFTPLSFSSSDAQFYSPPNSPELSLSDKADDETERNNDQFEDEDKTNPDTAEEERQRDVVSPYDTLPFEDAVQQHTDTTISNRIVKSASDQAIYTQWQNKDNKNTQTSATLKTRPNTLLIKKSLIPDAATGQDDDDAIDERKLTVDELIKRRKQKAMKKDGLELVGIIRDAEEAGFDPEEVSIAMTLGGDSIHPLTWLQDNWKHMVDTVMTLATNYGHERQVNDIGDICAREAKMALRMHKGNIWASVTECVELRQRKYQEISNRGKFSREDIIKALTNHEGDIEKAFLELNRSKQLGGFMSKIWAPFRRDNKKETSKDTKNGNIEKKEVKSIEMSEKKKETNAKQVEELLYVRQEDVVVHPLKAFTHYADLSVSEYADVPKQSKRNDEYHKSHKEQNESRKKVIEKVSRRTTVDRISQSNNEVEDTEDTRSLDNVKRRPLKSNSNLRFILEKSKSAPGSARTSMVMEQDIEDGIKMKDSTNTSDDETLSDSHDVISELEDNLEEILIDGVAEGDEEDNSISITTARLSLSFSDNNVDVKSQTIQTDKVSKNLDKVSNSEVFKDFAKTAHSYNEQADKSPQYYEAIQERPKEDSSYQEVNTATYDSNIYPNSIDETNGRDTSVDPSYTVNINQEIKGEIKVENLPTIPQVRESSSRSPSTPPVPVHKATRIVGMAIAKAMAREASRSSLRSDSMSSATSGTSTQMTSTPISTPESEEPPTPIALAMSESLSEDDELLRSLDTIPEEGSQFSDRTESGRNLTKPSNNFNQSVQPTVISKDLNLATNLINKNVYSEIDITSTINSENINLATNTTKKLEDRRTSIKEIILETIENEIAVNIMEQQNALDNLTHTTENQSTDKFGEHSTKSTFESKDRIVSQTADPDFEKESTPINRKAPISDNTVRENTLAISMKKDQHLSINKSAKPYIPPAVASYSGPIFIPPSHTYYNDPSENRSENRSPSSSVTSVEGFKLGSSDYESIYQMKRDLNQLMEDNNVVSSKIDDLMKPSPRDAPLLHEASSSQTQRQTEIPGEMKEASSRIIKISDKVALVKNTSLNHIDIQDSPKTRQNSNKLFGTDSSSPLLSLKSVNKDAVNDSAHNEKDQLISSEDQSPSNLSTEKRVSVKNKIKIDDGQEPKLKSSKKKVKSKTKASKEPNVDKPERQSEDKPSFEIPSPKSTVEDIVVQTSDSKDIATTSKTLSHLQKKLTPIKHSTMDSSGESEEEGRSINIQSVKYSSSHGILVKVEGLKKRLRKESDYQEVQELKTQIQNMRKELELGPHLASSDEEDMDESSERGGEVIGESGRGALVAPVIILQEPSKEEDEDGSEDGEVEEIMMKKEMTQEEKNAYEQLHFDRTVRRLLAEGQATTYDKAELAAQLMKFSFEEPDSIEAAEECSSMYTALRFLRQECELCAERYPMGKMVSMLNCTHRCCYECAGNYFTFQIKTKNIREMQCPFCKEPDLDHEDTSAEYLNNLDILLKSIIDEETHELFQRKLRDWTLMKDPNFKWCKQCSSGFIANPRARTLICPDCKDVTCAQCRRTWEPQHDGISCEAFEKWKAENNPETQAEGVARHLAECGITCPKCKFTYALAKGGCMHFTCTECKFEFCSGCGQPFKQGLRCTVGPYCERLGLHAHHPRNCLFYLRDKDPAQLENLLKENDIPFNKDVITDVETTPLRTRRECLVQEQKELPDGLKDDICGRIVLDGHGGLCRLHYTEHLVEKVNSEKLDPVSIFDEADLRVCLRRNGKAVPIRRWESEKLYRDKLIKLIKEQLPLS